MDDAYLSFAGHIVAGVANKQRSGGRVTGDTTITINSGTFKNIYGAGENGSVNDGNVTINYNGGTLLNEAGTQYKIYATKGANITKTATLNIGGTLGSSLFVASGFDVIATTTGGNLSVDEALSIGAAQALQVGAGSSVTVESGNTLSIDGLLEMSGGSITNSGTLNFGSGAIIDLSGMGGDAGELTYQIFTGNESASFDALSWGNIQGLTGVSASSHSVDFSASGLITFTARATQAIMGTLPLQ